MKINDTDVTNFAPIIIPTLCRYDHFKRCVESLTRCTHADKTELIIGLDFPLKESHKEGYSKISDYINSGISGFRKVTVIRHSRNIGAIRNYHYILDYAFNLYDRVIATEDDNEFSPNFLDYINKGLDLYKDSDDVVAICGYNYPVDLSDYPQNAYLSYNYSAWGYGLWKSKNEKYLKELTFETSCNILKSPTLLFKILKEKPTLAISLWHMSRRKTLLGDVNWETYNITRNHYSLFPRLSLVRNWGHDGTGINCSAYSDDVYINQKIDVCPTFNFSGEIKILPHKFNKRLRKFFGDRPYDLILRSYRFLKRHF